MFHIILRVHGGLGGELLGQLTVRVRASVHCSTWRVLDLPSITIDISLDDNTIPCVITRIRNDYWYDVVKDERLLVHTLQRAA
jgi:hypothetical protein